MRRGREEGWDGRKGVRGRAAAAQRRRGAAAPCSPAPRPPPQALHARSLFWMGVPLSAHRRSALSACAALAACVAGFFTVCACGGGSGAAGARVRGFLSGEQGRSCRHCLHRCGRQVAAQLAAPPPTRPPTSSSTRRSQGTRVTPSLRPASAASVE